MLFQLKYEALFTDREESYIYSIDDAYDCAKNNIYGTPQNVQDELEKYLGFYKDYSFDNVEKWQDFDNAVNIIIEKDFPDQQAQSEIYKQIPSTENKRPWWKFW